MKELPVHDMAKVYCFCFTRKGKEECKVNIGTTFQGFFFLVCFKTRKVEKIMWFYLFKWKHWLSLDDASPGFSKADFSYKGVRVRVRLAFDFISPTKSALYTTF